MKKAKLIFLVILLFITFIYILFVPEFKRSSEPNEKYIYIYSDQLFKSKYTVKNNEDITIDLKHTDKFSIYLPYNCTIAYKWSLISQPSNLVDLKKSYIRESRTPIYDRHKEGVDYAMQVFEFNKINSGKDSITFLYSNAQGDIGFKITLNLDL